MAVITYELREGYRVRGDLFAIASRVEEIQKVHGSEENPDGDAAVDEIIEEARNPESPLHPNFTWDETKAAHKHNRTEARYLMRCYQVRIIETDRKPIVISPANVRILRSTGESAYVATSVAMSRPEMKSRVIAEALGLLRGVRERLNRLQSISPRISAIVDELKVLMEKEIAEEPEEKTKPKAKGARDKLPQPTAQ